MNKYLLGEESTPPNPNHMIWMGCRLFVLYEGHMKASKCMHLFVPACMCEVCIYKFGDNEVSDNNLRVHKCIKDIMQVNFPEQWRSHGRLIMLHISSPPNLNQVNPNASISCKIVPTD